LNQQGSWFIFIFKFNYHVRVQAAHNREHNWYQFYTLQRWHMFTHEPRFPSSPGLQVPYSLSRWLARVSLRGFSLESSIYRCWKWSNCIEHIWHNPTYSLVCRVKLGNYDRIQSAWARNISVWQMPPSRSTKTSTQHKTSLVI
jgi:hypothetical protein